MLLICVQHGWDSGMTTYGKCILNRPEKHLIVFNLMEQHSVRIKFLHIYNNKIQYDTIQGTITCPLLWTHPDCQSSITDCRSEVQTAVAESRRPLSSWLCSQRPMNFTAIIPTHQCARTDVYTKLLRNYIQLYQLAEKNHLPLSCHRTFPTLGSTTFAGCGYTCSAISSIGFTWHSRNNKTCWEPIIRNTTLHSSILYSCLYILPTCMHIQMYKF